MSRCLTVRYTGLVDGIAVSSTGRPRHTHCVEMGCEYEPDWTNEDSELRCKGRAIALDRFRPPSFDGDLLHHASVIRVGRHSYLRAPYPTPQPGIIVLVDTAHTEPCDTGGGYWEALAGNPREIARGREGHQVYRVRRYNGLSCDPFGTEWSEQVDRSTCYDIGLLLMQPGDKIKVVFHAPGTVVGILEYVPRRGLKFTLTENEPDRTYEYISPDYQAEQDLEDLFPRVSMIEDDLLSGWY